MKRVVGKQRGGGFQRNSTDFCVNLSWIHPHPRGHPRFATNVNSALLRAASSIAAVATLSCALLTSGKSLPPAEACFAIRAPSYSPSIATYGASTT